MDPFLDVSYLVWSEHVNPKEGLRLLPSHLDVKGVRGNEHLDSRLLLLRHPHLLGPRELRQGLDRRHREAHLTAGVEVQHLLVRVLELVREERAEELGDKGQGGSLDHDVGPLDHQDNPLPPGRLGLLCDHFVSSPRALFVII